MSSVVLIASEASIARCGEQLKKELPVSRKLVIAEYYMEKAVQYARNSLPEDTDVIMARGNTARLLKNARLPVPVVTIPITDADLIRSVEKARAIYGTEGSSIAYMGIEDTIRSVSAFLSLLHRSIRFYPVKNSRDIEANIRQAKQDKVNVVIGGVYTRELALQAGLDCVLLETSLSSLKETYERALEVQKTTLLQKRKLLEQTTILNSISDGLISINEKGNVTMSNPQAERLLRLPPKSLTGKSCFSVLSRTAAALVNRALLSGQEILGHKEQLSGQKACVMDLRPLAVNGTSRGLLITLRRSRTLWQPSMPAAPSAVSVSDFSQLCGSAPCFREAVSAALLCARLSAPVLLTGQPGTGRSTFARCIHKESGRREELFFQKAASLLNEEDFLSAHGGTLFIRDIDQLSPHMAVVLEDFLENGAVVLKSGRLCSADVRIIASACRPLEGLLPPKLFYRISSLSIALPALAQRREDIPALAAFLLNRFLSPDGRACHFTPEALQLLKDAPWPGNLLQLEALCLRLSCFSPENGGITDEQIIPFMDNPSAPGSSCLTPDASAADSPVSLRSSAAAAIPARSVFLGGRFVTLAEIRLLEASCHGRRSLMAQKLGVSRSTLWRAVKRLEEMS
ncbi:MAG: PrpR N-terminal domain-containing protein [Eubacteriales bacterium]|nr:PrpR N-terminal domain-containing protein [Eubacteriales bacterium]